MRTETEIRQRLAFWQGMLAASQVGVAIIHPEFLLSLPKEWQGYALELLRLPPRTPPACSPIAGEERRGHC